VNGNNQNVPIAQVIEEPARERVTIKTVDPLTKGRYKVSMKFISYLNDQNKGFYRSSYIENGVRK
jgi:aminopeptidase N